MATACRTSVTEQSRNVVVNAPADGVVRRVLVGEGAAVDKDAAIIEIALQREHVEATQAGDTSADQARAVRAAQADLAAAEGEASRTAGDLRRIEPLVKRGLASQAELDKARAQSQDAQERLRLAREKAKGAEASRAQTSAAAANEEIITVRVPAGGIVQTLSVHAGQTVTSGQPVATLISNS
jgi:multidrug resistance efflux pump